MSLPNNIQKVIGLSSNEFCDGTKSNCFWATKFFYEPNSLPPKLLNGNEILKFIADDFTQVENPEPNDVFVIWNSSDVKISPDKLDIHFLATIPTGFPFGLIVEHSGILLEDGLVFQKASPKEIDRFEIIKAETAFAPYENLSWKRTTYQRRKT